MAILIKAETILDKLKDRLIAAKEWEIESAKNHNNELVNRAQAAQAAFVEVALTVKAMPTVDAVEVVRCKDCKHNSLNRKSGNAYCNLGIELYQLDDYCSCGERREDGGSD